MSESSTAGVHARYAAEVTADLERNDGERERVTTQIAELQQQLTALEQDRATLLALQAAIGGAAQPEAGLPDTAAVAEAQEETPETAAEAVPEAALEAATEAAPEEPKASRRRGKRAKGAGKARSGGGAASRRGGGASGNRKAPATAPTLVDVVADYLRQQTEPKSAAEVAEAVSTPEQTVAANRARTALEALVARAAVSRSRQGSSVYYEAAGDAPTVAAGEAPDASSAGDAGASAAEGEQAEALPGREKLSAEKVLDALAQLDGPQSARSIAEFLQGADVDSVAVNRVRMVLLRLTAKDQVEKAMQDGAVVFQARQS